MSSRDELVQVEHSDVRWTHLELKLSHVVTTARGVWGSLVKKLLRSGVSVNVEVDAISRERAKRLTLLSEKKRKPLESMKLPTTLS